MPRISFVEEEFTGWLSTLGPSKIYEPLKPKTVCEKIRQMEERHKKFLDRKYPKRITTIITASTRKKQTKDWLRSSNIWETQTNHEIDSLTYALIQRGI